MEGIIVLAAEFDIDKGSKEHAMLAEWMLPEGSHLHDEDSTFFILNRKEAKEKSNILSMDETTKTLDMAGMAFYFKNDEWTPIHSDEHVISVIGTIISTSLKSEYQVKHVSSTMTWNICGQPCHYTRNSLLLFPDTEPPLALRFGSVDDRIYFTEFLARYAMLNHVSSDFPNDFEMIANKSATIIQPFYTLNLVGTRQIPGARRGARPLLLLALDDFFITPTIDVIINLYNSLYALDLLFVPVFSFTEKKVARSILRTRMALGDTENHYISAILPTLKGYNPKQKYLEILDEPLSEELPVKYKNVTLPIKIPMIDYDTEMGDFSFSNLLSVVLNLTVCPFAGGNSSSSYPALRHRNNVLFMWHPHLDLTTATGFEGPQASNSPLLILLFALLTEKRVMFVGHGKPCGFVGNCVLACIAIASGGNLIPGVVDRCFPYASLAAVDNLLKTPGFVAGVVNPVFAEQAAWWDVCINLNNNKMIISPGLIKTANDSPKDSSEHTGLGCPVDDYFLQTIEEGIKMHLGEMDIRELVYNYIERFIDLTLHFSALTKVPPCWVNRVEGFQATITFNNLQTRGMRNRRTLFFNSNIQGMIQEISLNGKESNPSTIIRLYFMLDALIQASSDYQILEILSLLTCYDGSCLPFSYGLFCDRLEVSQAAARIIFNLFIRKLNPSFCNPFITAAVFKVLGAPPTLNIIPDASLAESPKKVLPIYTKKAILGRRTSHFQSSLPSPQTPKSPTALISAKLTITESDLEMDEDFVEVAGRRTTTPPPP